MSLIQRPLDHQAVQSADEQIYDAHEDDPRPNALFDADGNRQALSDTDPTQEGLRQEWREYYLAAVDAKKAGAADDDDDQSSPPAENADPPAPSPTPGSAGGDPGDAVAPCEEMHWITIEVKPLQNPEKRPDFWPAIPPDDAYAFEFFEAELTIGHAEDYLDQDASTKYPRIPAGTCQIKFSHAFKTLQDYFDSRVRGGEI